jgi:hypothetical protein
MYHRSWVYFMSINGPARINVSGEYQILSDGKTKVTLNLDKTTRDLELGTGLGAVSFNAIMMFPFSPNGFSQSYTYAHRRVFTAVSEQYNIIYFAYPSYFSVYPEAPKSFYLSHMVVMSYDIITGSIGYSIPWASDQVGVPLVPWGEDEIETTKGPDFTRGTRNFFAMTTLGYKPAKGKAKDVIVIGTSMYEYIGTGHFLMTEEQYDMGYYYLDPTVFYGKNWSAYTRSCVGTKIIRPDASKTRINRVRPIMRFGYNSSHYHPVCQVATFSDTSIGGVEIYSHDPFVEFGPYVDSPLELIDTDESTNIAADGSIILSDTVYGDEHIVVFSFHTESPNGPVEKAQFVTTTGIVGLEIFYDVQGKVSR